VPTAHLTKRYVDAIEIKPARYTVFDTELKGFGLRVAPSGRKSYIYQYRLGGRETSAQRITIGTHGSPWTPDNARKAAMDYAMKVHQGVDPLDTRKKKRSDSANLAFADYVEFYGEKYLKSNHKDGGQEAMRILRRDVVPVFKRKAMTEITMTDISDLLLAMDDRPASMRGTYLILNKLFNWAAGQNRGDISASPMLSMEAPRPVAKRTHVLAAEELACVWLASLAMPYPFGPFMRFLIATLQRRTIASAADWSQINLSLRQWHLRPAETKNGKPFVAPLNQHACDVIDELAPRQRGLLFTTTGSSAISGFTKFKARLDDDVREIMRERQRQRGEVVDDVSQLGPLNDWHLHDMRRTGATVMQSLGVPVEVTEDVLGHISGTRQGVAGVYNMHQYSVEKTCALDLWCEHINTISGCATIDERPKVWRYNHAITDLRRAQMEEAEAMRQGADTNGG